MSTIPERLTTKRDAAAHFHVSESTIKNWLRRGLITGYRINRYVVVDLDEIGTMLAESPPSVARAGKQPYGPKARIVTIHREVTP